MKIKTFLFSLFLIGFTVTLSAQTATPGVKKRQVRQGKRVKHGVKNGSLTKGEVYKIGKQQKRINRSKRAAKADGVVTKRERAGLHARQNAASRSIRRKKNN